MTPKAPPDPLKLFVTTWNMGNAPWSTNLGDWIPNDGSMDIVVVGTQVRAHTLAAVQALSNTCRIPNTSEHLPRLKHFRTLAAAQALPNTCRGSNTSERVSSARRSRSSAATPRA
jgi:hypothetical protein